MQCQASKSLVFVVGAAASKDFGSAMPVGAELATHIETVLNQEFGNTDFVNGPIRMALRMSGVHSPDDFVEAANRIRSGLGFKSSIDDLLNEWRDKPEMLLVAKYAIAHQILSAENSSILASTTTGDDEAARSAMRQLRSSWLHHLVTHIRKDQDRRNVEATFGDLAFITFNYDRCIEQFLYWAFQMMGNLDRASAAAQVKSVPIVHAYGDLGTLPYEQKATKTAAFGASNHLSKCVASRIKTYTEEDHDAASMRAIHSLIAGAQKLIFLGFGYHQRNLDLFVF